MTDKPDISYFKSKINCVLRDLDNYTKIELWREMSRITSGATGLDSAEELKAENMRLNDFCKEFVYYEGHPINHELMSEAIDRVRADNESLRAELTKYTDVEG